MALDAFLKIATIKGDSVVKGFEDWIIVESFSWGEERPSGGTGTAVPLETQVVTNTQTSSPSLFEACATGENLGNVQLHVRRAGTSQTFLKWDLANAVIGSYRIGASASSEVATDQFSIAFTALTYSFSEIDAKGGVGSPITKTVTFTP